MCRVSDSLDRRRAAQDRLSAACLPHIEAPLGGALDRASELLVVIPEDWERLLDRLPDDEGGTS